MGRKDYFHLFFLVSLYLILLVIFKQHVFSYRFNPVLIERFFCSQEMIKEPPCKRLFLSDAEVLISSGYLYAKGSDPTVYHFQHPPLIKYMFGYSILLFNNPYFVQIAFGILLLLLTYFLCQKSLKISEISLFACLFLLIDPLFLNLTADASLDLGQAVFILSYFILIIFYKKRFVSQGVVLGLLFATKFWGGSLFFISLLMAYLLYKRQLNFKKYLVSLGIAFVVFSLIYLKTFIGKHGLFNIIFFELKTLKFWINHSTSSIFGSSFMLFLTGYMKSWWGNNTIVKSEIWSVFWVFGFITSLASAFREFSSKKINIRFLINSIPFLYLVYLGIQAPFARYFILILPFVYISLSSFIFEKLLNKKT